MSHLILEGLLNFWFTTRQKIQRPGSNFLSFCDEIFLSAITSSVQEIPQNMKRDIKDYE